MGYRVFPDVTFTQKKKFYNNSHEIMTLYYNLGSRNRGSPSQISSQFSQHPKGFFKSQVQIASTIFLHRQMNHRRFKARFCDDFKIEIG